MIVKNKRGALFLTCLLLTGFIFVLHVLPQVNSMINYVKNDQPANQSLTISEEFLTWAVNYHKTQPDFKKRAATTFLIDVVVHVFDVKVSIAFVWVNFIFLFLTGFLISYLAQLYGLSKSDSLISVIGFYLSFSVLLAFFIPIATYDEPIQYFLILLSFIAWKKNKRLLFFMAISSAIIARENTLILLPAMVLFLLDIDFKKLLQTKIKTIVKLIWISAPVLIYALYLVWFYKENPEAYEQTKEFMNESRFGAYEKNFRNIGNISRTLLAFSSVCLLPIVMVLFYKKKKQYSALDLQLINAFWLTFWLNTTIIFITVYAEESRVFALPLLFIIPIIGKMFRVVFKPSKAFFKFLIHPLRAGIILIVSVISWFTYNYLYSLTDINATKNFYVEYNVCAAVFILLIVLNRIFVRKYSV